MLIDNQSKKSLYKKYDDYLFFYHFKNGIPYQFNYVILNNLEFLIFLINALYAYL